MPQVVIEIQHLILDLNSEISQLTAIIETDQAMATKVLKMANSAFYGMSGISCDDDETSSELETGTMDFIGLRQDEISDTMLKVVEAVDQL